MPILKRAFMFLEDGDFIRANEYLERALDQDPENAEAYVGKLMYAHKVRRRADLKNVSVLLDTNAFYHKAMKFGDDALRAELKGYNDCIKTRFEQQRIEGKYIDACEMMNNAKENKQYTLAAYLFSQISDYKNSQELREICINKANEYIHSRYMLAKSKMDMSDKQSLLEAYEIFTEIKDYKDSEELANEALLKEQAIQVEDNYQYALYLIKNSMFSTAIKEFESIIEYKDSKEQIQKCKDHIEENKKALKKTAKRIAIAFCAVAIVILIIVLWTVVISPMIKYNDAKSLMEDKKYVDAANAFAQMNDYEDSSRLVLECYYLEAKELMDNGKYADAISIFKELDDYSDSAEMINKCKYLKATQLMEKAEYEQAIEIFFSLDGYGDSTEKMVECKDLIRQPYYDLGKELMEKGEYAKACISFSKADGYQDSQQLHDECYKKACKAFKNNNTTIAAGYQNTVGVKTDGTVRVVGNRRYFDNFDVDYWTGIVSVSVGNYYTVGLTKDGTMRYAGDYECIDAQYWEDIVAISSGPHHVVGLKDDGTVVVVREIEDKSSEENKWTDIVAVSAGTDHTVGLKVDGTVVSTQKDSGVEKWEDIVFVSAGFCTAGIKSDGTVVATGDSDVSKEVEQWTDIVSVSVGDSHIVGLKKDGTVVAAGNNDENQCNVQKWSGIVAVSSGAYHTVGLKADGTVVATEITGRANPGEKDRPDKDHNYGQCLVSRWEKIRVPKK